MKKIDIHVHTTIHRGLSLPRWNGDDFASPVQILDKYNDWGISCGILLPEVSNECCFYPQSNEDIYLLTQDYKNKFYWFCNLSPRMGNNDSSTDFSYFINYYKELGALGVGELTFNLYFDDPMTENLLYHCEKCSMPVIFHIAPKIGGCYGLADDLGLPRLEKMLRKFPSLIFIGHSQPFWAEISDDIDEKSRNSYPGAKIIKEGRLQFLLRKYPNLYCDLSAGSGGNALMRDPDYAYKFICEFSDRLMFGTDICAPSNYMPLSFWLDEIHKNKFISDEAYNKICYENAVKILKIPV